MQIRQTKIEHRQLTTVELVGTHQHPPKILFAPLFLSKQGHDVDVNEVMQDNKSAIPLEKLERKVLERGLEY